MNPAETSAAVETSADGKALAGFLLSGFLLALLGAVLPAWNYHRNESEFTAVGNYFLSLAVGIVAASGSARLILARRGLPFLLISGCTAACGALAYLALVGPPLSAWWRVAGLLVLGIGAGFINIALFHAVSRRYFDAAGTVNRGGIWYGLGCLIATLLVAGTFYIYTVSSILVFMAVVPGIFAGLYAKTAYATPPPGAQPTIGEAVRDFRSPSALVFAFLLLFQFGNEWSIAGWLPLFLLHRVHGLSPPGALLQLALYWLCLLAGRLVAVAILPRVKHRRLLMGSVLSALFGCLILYSTDNAFGAATSVILLGLGYASMYPLVIEAIGRRFPYYQPGFFNGIFSWALVGGLLAPATLGYAASAWGVGVVIGIPLVGTFMVTALLPLIWLEAKVSGR